MSKPGLCTQSIPIHTLLFKIYKLHDIPYEKLHKWCNIIKIPMTIYSFEIQNVVKLYVHISPVFSRQDTNVNTKLAS